MGSPSHGVVKAIVSEASVGPVGTRGVGEDMDCIRVFGSAVVAVDGGKDVTLVIVPD